MIRRTFMLTFSSFILIRNSCIASSNPPTINFDKSYARVPEDSKPGTVIALVTATGRNTKNVYIISANTETQDLVDINTVSTGITTRAEIKLKGNLDRESLLERIIIIKACDCLRCLGCLYTTKALTIFVSDVNDEAPVFQNQPYQFEIPENSKVGTSVGSIKAIDRDNGLGGQVHYNLMANALYQGTFSIGLYSGLLQQNRPLDYETLNFYQYTVTAADYYNKSMTANVLIKIKDEQDKPPIFQGLPYVRNIPETSNTTGMSAILQIKAIDGDFGVPNEVDYMFENGSICNNLFQIDAKSGMVTAKGVLDRDNGILNQIGGYCMINVTAYEVGNNVTQYGESTSTTLVTINVEDVNDNKPQFDYPHYDAHIREGIANVPINVNGQWIKVHDDDQGRNSHFNLTVLENGKEINFLKASPSEVFGSGEILIRLAETFRFEYGKTKNISIQVVATEMETPEHWSAFCDIDITIIDVKGPIVG